MVEVVVLGRQTIRFRKGETVTLEINPWIAGLVLGLVLWVVIKAMEERR
jgi:hypothetical protein